ncbi:MAG: hypothetical protein ACOYXW_13740 [Actinomycetota bacterium]
MTFDSAELARLCNSEQMLASRFGAEMGRTVARRLWDLAAVDAAALGRLPETVVESDGSGETRLTFGGWVLVRGVVTLRGQSRASADGDGMLISSVEGIEVR